MYKYNRDIILTDCDLKSEENFLEFIKLEYDGDYSFKHQLKLCNGKYFLWKGKLSESAKEKILKRINDASTQKLAGDSANLIWSVQIDGYKLEDIATPESVDKNYTRFNVDPTKINFEKLENPTKICKHCGNIYLPSYDFIEDEHMCDHLNSMFGGTYEHSADWPDYCTKCLEDLYNLDIAKNVYEYFRERDVIK